MQLHPPPLSGRLLYSALQSAADTDLPADRPLQVPHQNHHTCPAPRKSVLPASAVPLSGNFWKTPAALSDPAAAAEVMLPD